jgi:DNA-binding HxlR family transcriptional regulator
MAGRAQAGSLDGTSEASTGHARPPAVGGGAFETTLLSGIDEETVCPYFHQAVELVGKRWTGAIVGALLPGPHRFCEIAQAIPQISDRLLSMRLRELESESIVERQVLSGSPVRVEYTLTQKGRALEPAIGELRVWARQWLRA